MTVENLLLAAAAGAALFLVLSLTAAARSSDPAGGSTLVQRLVGLGSAAGLGPVGYAFPVGTPLALTLGVVAPKPGNLFRTRLARIVLAAAGLGVAGFLVASSATGAPLARLGLLSFLSFAVFFFVDSRICSTTADVARVLAWTAGSSVFFYVVIGTENTAGSFAHLWKYGIGVPLAFVAVYVASRTTISAVYAALLVFGAAAVFLGFRSQGLVCFVTAILLLIRRRAEISGHESRQPARRGRLVLRYAAGAALVLVVGQLLTSAIEQGTFGSSIRDRTLDQSVGGGPLLLAGRVEPPLSFAAVAAHPLLGWGNADTIDTATLDRGASLASRLGLGDPSQYMPLWIRPDGHVQLHSVLFEGWVEGGILGVLLPFGMLVLMLMAAFRATGRLAPLVVLACVQGTWDVVFSTWGYNRPPILAATVVLAVAVVSRRPQTVGDGRDAREGARTGLPLRDRRAAAAEPA